MELTKNNMQPFAADYTKVRSAGQSDISLRESERQVSARRVLQKKQQWPEPTAKNTPA
jgi:hypothetical protein